MFVELPIDEAYAPLRATIVRTALLLLAAFGLALLGGMFLVRKMVVPVETLRAGAARIGGGDLSQRISVKTGDELESLADQFNDMASKLQDSSAPASLNNRSSSFVLSVRSAKWLIRR